MDTFDNEFDNTAVSVRVLYAERLLTEGKTMSKSSACLLPEDRDDIEFVMDDFQRSAGKSKPVREVQFLGESQQSEESANSADSPRFES